MKLFHQYAHLRKSSLLYFAAVLIGLSLLTNAYLQVKPSTGYQQKLLQRYITKEQKDAEQLLQDSSLMRRLVLNTESISDFNRLYAKRYGFFLFAETISETPDLLFWNNQKIVPPPADFSLSDGAYFQHLPNGYYVVVKKTLRLSGMTNNILTYVLIPVLHKYYLETDYLLTEFVHDKDAVKQISISLEKTDYVINSAQGKTLFYLHPIAHAQAPVRDMLTTFFRLAALLLLLFFLQLQAESVVRKNGFIIGISFLVACLLFLRVILFYYPDLFLLRQFQLFHPDIYAHGTLNPSLGDLLINSVLLCWIIIFCWNNIPNVNELPSYFPKKRLYAVGALAILFLIVATFSFAGVVNSLVTDSKISFSVTDFFSLSIYTIYGFIILAIISLSYYYFSRLLYGFIFRSFKNHIFIYFFIAGIGLLFLTVRTGHSIVLFQLPILLWLIVYTLILSQHQFLVNRLRITIAGILFWIFIFSASLAALILQANKESEIRKQQAIAAKVDQLTDPSSERTLSIALAYIDNRFLKNNFFRFYNGPENRYFRDSLIGENFKGYSNKYDTKIFVFDSSNSPVNNDEAQTYAELNTIYNSQTKPTGIPNLFYHEMSFDRFSYMTRRVVRDDDRYVGTLFIISTPKQYGSTEALYPELFRSANKNDVENSPLYSYAVYENNLLITSSAKYPFRISLTPSEIPKEQFEKRTNADYDELWYRAGNKKVIVVAKKQDSVIASITLFSYLFCAFLFMVAILQLFSFLVDFARDWRAIHIFTNLNIRTQIHGTVIFISLLSFIIIGAATISFFITRYNRNNIDKLSRTAAIAVKEIQKKAGEDSLSTNQESFYDSTVNATLTTLVHDIADIHNVDVNLYDLDGNLEVSSDEDVYKKGILSNKMHPLAFYHLKNLREVQRVQEEKMSTLNYLSIYNAIRDEKGKVYAYLNIPYFSSQLDLKQEISNFLVTIINLNAFIFLIAGIIALFITNKITASFSIISDKMKAITLGKTNEQIVWEKNDEIGELVRQYNKMVHQLEQSAEALAKSEREGAWREMARQVAHEIKNPLTPMKLSIQYLQKSINNNSENVKELTANVANTLIEQIDHLSKIAADFSQFANIDNKKIELVDLHHTIGSLIELYKSNPKAEIVWNSVEGSVVMKTDKTHMNRLFTNLLTNAVDACSGKKNCIITISEQRKKDSILISVKDNGAGIRADMRSKIFTPNFTTKTSGTGLGLAMCKSITEQAGGKIWFETEEGVGTTFYVQLPVIS